MDTSQINIILRNPTWDLIALFAFISVGFFYGIFAGRSKLLAFLFSLYVSGFLFENFIYLEQFQTKTFLEIFLIKIIAFTLLAVILTFMFSKFFSSSLSSGPKTWWKALFLSFSSAGLFFSYLFHLLPAKSIFTFSPIIQTLFASDTVFFWWLVLPLMVIFIVRE